MMCGFPFYVFFGNKQQLDRNTLIVGTVFQLTWNRRVTCSQSPVKNGERYQRTRLSFDVDYTIVYIPTWWPKLSTLPKHFSFSFPVEIPDKPERVICFLFDEKQTNKQTNKTNLNGLVSITDAHLFAAIVGIESVVDDVDGFPGILILADDSVNWHTTIVDIVSVKECRSQTRRTRCKEHAKRLRYEMEFFFLVFVSVHSLCRLFN